MDHGIWWAQPLALSLNVRFDPTAPVLLIPKLAVIVKSLSKTSTSGIQKIGQPSRGIPANGPANGQANGPADNPAVGPAVGPADGPANKILRQGGPKRSNVSSLGQHQKLSARVLGIKANVIQKLAAGSVNPIFHNREKNPELATPTQSNKSWGMPSKVRGDPYALPMSLRPKLIRKLRHLQSAPLTNFLVCTSKIWAVWADAHRNKPLSKVGNDNDSARLTPLPACPEGAVNCLHPCGTPFKWKSKSVRDTFLT